MRPSFARLVKSLYPKFKDHESVKKYDNIKGINSNLLFFDHTAEENSTTVDGSKINTAEAKLVVELVLYLLKQDVYSSKNIVILTMYKGQLMEIRRILKERASASLSQKYLEHMNKMQENLTRVEDDDNSEEGEIVQEEATGNITNLLPRVSSVDDFQGEESDIIILSLVRSNDIQTNEGEGNIGFLKTSNRICVALTRAKKGMYIFGNATLLAKKSDLWNNVISTLQKDNALDTKLELCCQNHPDTKTVIRKAEDFRLVSDGGCSRPCEVQLECGHGCPRRCHLGYHDEVVCPHPCAKTYESCRHTCSQVYHGSSECPPCETLVFKTFPECGHSQEMECRTEPKSVESFALWSYDHFAVSSRSRILLLQGSMPENPLRMWTPMPRICDGNTLENITEISLAEFEETDRFYQLQDCSHLFEVSRLDTWMDSDDTEAEEEEGKTSTAVKIKECPLCKTPVWTSARYANVVKAKFAKMNGEWKVKQGQKELEEGRDPTRAFSLFMEALELNPVLMEAHLGAGQALIKSKSYAHGAVFLSFIVKKSSYASEVETVLKSTIAIDKVLGISKVVCPSPKEEVAVMAMVQLASAFIVLRDLSGAVKLCEVVLKSHPQNEDAMKLKEDASKRLKAEAAQAAGNGAFHVGKHAEAVDHYTAAMAHNGDSLSFYAVCLYNRARAFQVLGLIGDAIADFNWSIAIDPKSAQAIYGRATFSMLNIPNVQEARALLAEAEQQMKKSHSIDHHMLLGVKPGCTSTDIKKAYKKAALKHHPDKIGQFLPRSERGGGDGRLWKDIGESDEISQGAEHVFKLIGEAYATLSNSHRHV
ncbi:hypothetical protein R1flu_013369 [Riccia fluitans]|uniref:J domain-containing protein n=1 Tax=Riccia fluitans TaxID=41844 RepID=A0ABD1YD45_9MARC